jgi:hypothetical protein
MKLKKKTGDDPLVLTERNNRINIIYTILYLVLTLVDSLLPEGRERSDQSPAG